MKKTIYLILILFIFSCKKKKEEPTYEVTYVVTNVAPPFVLTAQSDLVLYSDTIKTASFELKQTYHSQPSYGFQCWVETVSGKACKKYITIYINGTQKASCQDSLYSSLQCQAFN